MVIFSKAGMLSYDMLSVGVNKEEQTWLLTQVALYFIPALQNC
jgi:hypothetical protein